MNKGKGKLVEPIEPKATLPVEEQEEEEEEDYDDRNTSEDPSTSEEESGAEEEESEEEGPNLQDELKDLLEEAEEFGDQSDMVLGLRSGRSFKDKRPSFEVGSSSTKRTKL